MNLIDILIFCSFTLILQTSISKYIDLIIHISVNLVWVHLPKNKRTLLVLLFFTLFFVFKIFFYFYSKALICKIWKQFPCIFVLVAYFFLEMFWYITFPCLNISAETFFGVSGVTVSVMVFIKPFCVSTNQPDAYKLHVFWQISYITNLDVCV